MEWGFYYILDENGKPVAVRDILEWGRWLGQADRRVGWDKIGETEISTVFLGIDHNWGKGPPILWETMIFNDKNFENYQKRCSGSREQAEAMHQEAVTMVEAFYGVTKNKKKDD